ncbi:CPXCG motif-containing cysteine-rich protein [Amphritea balenae]|uniref:CPXCG motif-containing cysteine-rich protein n=1 Tax=Amphritea balenae TaxID=452629 RepID=A0A3P1SJK1_9GAMM|nr:CPXCG motif-containing cysteine-rich protein [Amphritea balenae]RRC97049.1 CPXCG motif-containing cysteine-rich protein [Amphritea balenae]GGK67567.1 hypothetical protein GCM10007941_17100 [Amphritea balenae]
MQPIEQKSAACPYCGEMIELVLDLSVGEQEYIEDCQVCCRPVSVALTIDESGVQVTLNHENEA